jgi:hypothetical protein
VIILNTGKIKFGLVLGTIAIFLFVLPAYGSDKGGSGSDNHKVGDKITFENGTTHGNGSDNGSGSGSSSSKNNGGSSNKNGGGSGGKNGGSGSSGSGSSNGSGGGSNGSGNGSGGSSGHGSGSGSYGSGGENSYGGASGSDFIRIETSSKTTTTHHSAWVQDNYFQWKFNNKTAGKKFTKKSSNRVLTWIPQKGDEGHYSVVSTPNSTYRYWHTITTTYIVYDGFTGKVFQKKTSSYNVSDGEKTFMDTSRAQTFSFTVTTDMIGEKITVPPVKPDREIECYTEMVL